MVLSREITFEEKRLLDALIKKSSLKLSEDWDKNLLVAPMADGEMGSLYLFPTGKINMKRKFGNQVSEIVFKDKDGIDVITSLNLDTTGELYELDIWKTDFSPVIEIPDRL